MGQALRGLDIRAELGGRGGGQIAQAVLQERGGFGHFERHCRGIVQGLLDERGALVFGALVSHAHGIVGRRIALHGFGEELAVRFERIGWELGKSGDHGPESRRHGCGRRGSAASSGRGGGGGEVVQKLV